MNKTKKETFAKLEAVEGGDTVRADGGVSGEGADVASFVGSVEWPPIIGTMVAIEGMADPPPPTGRGARGRQIWWAIGKLSGGGVRLDLMTAEDRNQAIRNKIEGVYGKLPDSETAFKRHVQRVLSKHCNPVKQSKPVKKQRKPK